MKKRLLVVLCSLFVLATLSASAQAASGTLQRQNLNTADTKALKKGGSVASETKALKKGGRVDNKVQTKNPTKTNFGQKVEPKQVPSKTQSGSWSPGGGI